jgi:hypothetical protein
MDDMLTEEEISDAIQHSKYDLPEYSKQIASAQSAKTKAALVAENWKSPEEVSQFLDDHVRITNRAVDQARADERKVIGAILKAKEIKSIDRVDIDHNFADALLKGERP